MILKEEYLDDVKEHIKGMDETEFTKRGTTKEAVLEKHNTMERLWCVYQKDIEDYGCDRDFSLNDAVDEVLGVPPMQKKTYRIGSSALYRCPFCGSTRFIGHQIIRASVYVGGDGQFEDNLPGGLEPAIYDAEKPYGPFTCDRCGQEFDELPEDKRVRLPRGEFIIVSGDTVRKFKEAGYGYSHEDGGYTIVSDGKSAVAVSNQDYDRYYGGQRSFML